MAWRKHRQTLEAGSRAPEFTLPTLEGSSASLKDILAAGPALLAFFKVTCPVCQFTFPFLERIHRGATAGGFRVFGVSQDDARRTREFNREYGITFPTLLDDEAKNYAASNAFGITTVPSLFLVEKDGSISMAVEGFSKRDIEQLGSRAGVSVFEAGEYVPEWKAG